MATWVWIALGLFVLVALQLVALQYARRMSDDGEGSRAQPTVGRSVETTQSQDRDRTRSEGGRVVCPDCGTPNDPAYSYCRECVSALA